MWSLPLLSLVLVLRHSLGSRALPAAESQTGGEFFGLYSFDYVIIGGGTGGLAMANRLSADPSVRVAVIEAGTDYSLSNPLLSSTPAADSAGVGSSPSDSNLVDWNMVTVAQAGAAGRKVHYARGKCLGGSSGRNFMIYQRGTVQSMQQWAEAVDDAGYEWDKFLPYYKKSVAFRPPSASLRAGNATPAYNPAAFDDGAGPLEVTFANYAQPFASWMAASFDEIGMPAADDFNSGTLSGAQYCTSTIDAKMRRESSETSFLEAARKRSNLKVFTLTMAKKIIFDKDKRATGVVIKSGLITRTLTARKEVILSAGAFQSPQMLMVSGIGPRATLDKHRIPVIVDLPGVGQSMEDHVFFGPTFRVNVGTPTTLANGPLAVLGEFFGPYSQRASGPLTNPSCDFLGWEKVPRELLSDQAVADLARFPDDWPEAEYLVGPGYIGDFSNLLTTQPKDGYQYATILAALVAPLSRGTVTISSPDTSVLPVVDPNWLTHPTDKAVAVALYKRARAAFASDAMRPVLADTNEYYPGDAVQTDDQILARIQKDVMTVWHAACTCRMGKPTDPNAVVDSKARVFGVTALRVVDASAFAALPPGHPQSTVYALAEKIADDILNG